MTSFVLKILAALSMLCDHAGLILFPKAEILRIIGRIAFPIFAFCIAEGFRYTHDRVKYFLRIFILGLLCQIVYYIADRDLYLGVLITFSLSIIVMAVLDLMIKALKGEDSFLSGVLSSLTGKKPSRTAEGIISFIILLVTLAAMCLLTNVMTVDYGFIGIMIPPFVFLLDGKWPKLMMLTAGLVLLAAAGRNIMNNQWYALLAVPLIALYNGKPGKHRMKYFFYIFYPAHLAVLYLISQFVR